MSDRIKHLEMIQGAVTRMANSSAWMKRLAIVVGGWCCRPGGAGVVLMQARFRFWPSSAIGPQLAKLSGAYPRAQHVLEAAAVGQREKAILARLWISEGIPFAFRKCPGLYEEVRHSLAKGLELDAKQISVVGSGRLGYSLTPKKWGAAYDATSSDLDFFTESERLFNELQDDFERWREDYGDGTAQPRRKSDLEKGVYRFVAGAELEVLRQVLGDE